MPFIRRYTHGIQIGDTGMLPLRSQPRDNTALTDGNQEELDFEGQSIPIEVSKNAPIHPVIACALHDTQLDPLKPKAIDVYFLGQTKFPKEARYHDAKWHTCQSQKGNKHNIEYHYESIQDYSLLYEGNQGFVTLGSGQTALQAQDLEDRPQVLIQNAFQHINWIPAGTPVALLEPRCNGIPLHEQLDPTDHTNDCATVTEFACPSETLQRECEEQALGVLHQIYQTSFKEARHHYPQEQSSHTAEVKATCEEIQPRMKVPCHPLKELRKEVEQVHTKQEHSKLARLVLHTLWCAQIESLQAQPHKRETHGESCIKHAQHT
jgi:hypothetical protein